MKKECFGLIFVLFLIGIIGATTYYVSPSGSNSNNGSSTRPWLTIPYGIGQMSTSGGDTLIIQNGTYSGSANDISSLTPGTPTNYNIIKAESDGGVTISSSFSIAPEPQDNFNAYVQFEGLKFSSTESKGCNGNYTKFKRCAFVNGQVCSSDCNGAVNYGAGSHQLYEDCWFYGVGGRYTLIVYDGGYNVFRRCIIRHESGSYTNDGSNPEATVAVYNSDHLSFQNCIIIDNDLTTYSSYWMGPLYITGHVTIYPNNHVHASNSVEFIGDMIINSRSSGGSSVYCDTDDGSTGMNFTDFIIYGDTAGISDGNTGTNLRFNRLTLGKLSDAAFYQWDGAIYLNNSILYNYTNIGDGSPSIIYTDSYNPNSFSGTGVIHIDPITNGLRYLPRIENGSTLKTSGSGSNQMGAQILYKIGRDGTMYGETGFNEVTNQSLWPFPNEARIKNDMKAVSTRGFCSSGNGLYGGNITLTSYIWEALGNPCPNDICNYNGTVSPPTTNKTTVQNLIINFKQFKTGQNILIDYVSKIKEWLIG
jgi:hypothetical protein